MKTQSILLAALLVVAVMSFVAAGGAAPGLDKHRIVFQVTSEGDEQWDAVLNNIENVRESFGPTKTEIALIAHGKGLGMVLAAKNQHVERMKRLADGGVAFVACENTMKRKKVTTDQLLPFVTTVDSGVAEVVRKQEQGWSYLKYGP